MATIEEKARVYSGLDQTLESNNLLDNCWYDDEQMIEDFQKAMEE